MVQFVSTFLQRKVEKCAGELLGNCYQAASLTIMHIGGQYASLLVMVSSISEPDVEGR